MRNFFDLFERREYLELVYWGTVYQVIQQRQQQGQISQYQMWAYLRGQTQFPFLAWSIVRESLRRVTENYDYEYIERLFQRQSSVYGASVREIAEWQQLGSEEFRRMLRLSLRHYICQHIAKFSRVLSDIEQLQRVR